MVKSVLGTSKSFLVLEKHNGKPQGTLKGSQERERRKRIRSSANTRSLSQTLPTSFYKVNRYHTLAKYRIKLFLFFHIHYCYHDSILPWLNLCLLSAFLLFVQNAIACCVTFMSWCPNVIERTQCLSVGNAMPPPSYSPRKKKERKKMTHWPRYSFHLTTTSFLFHDRKYPHYNHNKTPKQNQSIRERDTLLAMGGGAADSLPER
ncbi:hypothetical protein BDP55DRAFT_258639 [Colletotrichum godetiae]|uniref:Uncharacterized protein n=1 Tax=Colletotrichum godetiae TaxID=1209918 RepID=A0AAJ0AVP0_9PEZI|nr:uncharacterized protein BDP55DRAFT_258639 [Colletotrichum godetiae]KAK1691233.1 hypothetical protein BDP55DRAFT_258639 [Colletotrichum godetiae]